jgi:methionyl-tRNA formyltransferase
MLAWQEVAAVVTKQKPPHHKDQAPVELVATKHGIPIYFANNKSGLDDLFALESFYKDSSFGIVIDYGVIISEQVINSFPLGIINSHFSILPEWRGADPITFSLLSGQKQTGVSLMIIDKGLDTGKLLATQTYSIKASDDNKTLTTQLINISDKLLQNTLSGYISGKIQPQDQPNQIATYSTKLSKASGVLNGIKPASVIEREIRACKGWPTSRIMVNDTWITIHEAEVSELDLPINSLVIDNKKLYFGTKYKSLNIKLLQPAGKKIMDASAFINGYAHLIK